MELEQELAMGVKPAERCGRWNKVQQGRPVLCHQGPPCFLALQGQGHLELEAWLNLQRWQGAKAEVPEEEAR